MKKILLFIFLLPTLAFAQLELPFPIKLVNPKPVDFWYFESDGTPYDNTGEVTTQVLSAIRYRGMTFNVNGVEYWFGAGIADVDLVIKSTAGNLTGAITSSGLATSLGSFTSNALGTAISDPVRTVTGTDAIVQADNGRTIYFNSATPFNFTIDALTINTFTMFRNIGTATVSFVDGSGVTSTGATELLADEVGGIEYITSTTPIISVVGSGGGSGTVTSVAASVPSFLSISGSPITTSGTLAISLSGTALPAANGGTGLTSLGTGVATWLGTPSYSNLGSALTGTSLWPLLATGGTLTGVNTYTSNTANQQINTGTYTTTANQQYHQRTQGSYTLRATSSDEFYTGVHNETLVAGANSQKLVSLKINPTFTLGAFTGVSSVGLLVETGSVFIGTGIMNSTTKFSVRGIDDTSGTITATFKNGTGNDLLTIYGDGLVALRDGKSLRFRGNESISSPAAGQLTFFTAAAAVTTGAYRFRWGGSSSTSGIIPTMVVESSGSVNPTSGHATFPSVQVTTPYNVTGSSTANGVSFYSSPIITLLPTLTGFKHEPTNPSNITTNIAFHAVTGQSLLGGTTVTASTTLDVRGVSSGTALRIANNSNTELWDFKNDGSLEIGGSTGTAGQVLTSSGVGAPPVWTDQTIRTVKVTLSSAEILNSFSSAKQLIAAPGSGKVIEVISTTLRYNYLTAPYATNTVLALYYSTVETTSYSGIIDQSISTIKMASTGINFNSASSTFDNQAVFLGTKTGNPTAGSGTLDVYVTYRIITL